MKKKIPFAGRGCAALLRPAAPLALLVLLTEVLHVHPRAASRTLSGALPQTAAGYLLEDAGAGPWNLQGYTLVFKSV